MKKIITVIVVLAFIWALPPVRAQLGAAALPVLERLGPAGEAVIRPAQREAAKKQISSIMRVLAVEAGTGRGVPATQPEFRQFLQRMTELSGDDPWGNPYWMTKLPAGVVVGSSGPDGIRGNDDDIQKTGTF